MDLNELITICLFYTIIGVDLVSSLGTFGSEHVHIKVIIPADVSSSKGILKHKHPVVHHVRHKIIHHYHAKRRPTSKIPIKKQAPLLESIYLAELDKPHHKHHFQQRHFQQHHEGYDEHDEHVETVKVNEEKPQYHYQPKKHVEYDYKIPKDEVLNVIQSPKYAQSVNDHYEPQVEELENNHDYLHPQTKTEIVKPKPTVSNKYYKSYDPEYHLLHDISKKSWDVIKTKEAKNHNYENNYQIYYGYQQPNNQKEEQEYHPYQKAPEINYNSSHKPDVSIDSQQFVSHTSTVHKPSHHYKEHTMAATDLSTNNNAKYEPTYNNGQTYEANFQKYLPSSESPPENAHATETYTGFEASGGFRYDMS